MSDFNFKSSGRLQSEITEQADALSQPSPIGIKTPLRFGVSSDGIFSMHYDRANQIRDNLRNLILTNKGERLGLYDFGADLRSMVFDTVTEDILEFEERAMVAISESVSKYMPYLNLKSFEADTDNSGVMSISKARIRVIYDVPSLGIENQAIEVTLFAGG